MRLEVLTQRDDLMIRRVILEPGDATPWHTDVCHRFSVLVRGDHLTLEFHDSGERVEMNLHPGLTGWDEPEARVHRAVNSGSGTYEEVVTFFLETPGLDPQPAQR